MLDVKRTEGEKRPDNRSGGERWKYMKRKKKEV